MVCIIAVGSTVAKADEKLVDLVKKVKPSVVLISTFDKDNKPIAQGSGFFIDNKGRLITNHHVIEGAYSATIKTSTGKEYPVQGIVAKDTEADIVKLVVNLPDANMTFLNLCENLPSEGEDIFVIGNPLGLESTVSSGIVSAVRDIPAFGKIFQITAPVSSGSSGSPVINSKGEVIGIATLIFTEGQNLNFAIPSEKILALKETAKIPLLEEYTAGTTDVNDAKKLLYKGVDKYLEKNWTAALTYFQQVVADDPNNVLALCSVGDCYNKLCQYIKAIEAYKQAVRIKPDFAEAHYNLAVFFCQIGKYQEAVEACKEATKIDPNYANAHFELGFAYQNLGNNEKAIEAFNEAIRIKPDYAQAYFDLGIIYSNLGRHEDAIKLLKQAIHIKPDYAEAYYNLGVTYGSLGNYQEVIEMCKQAIQLKPTYFEAQSNIGAAYYNLGRYNEAIEASKAAIRLEPNYTLAHYNLGMAYLQTGDKDSAIEEYKILKTLDAGMANELFNLIYK